MYQAIAHFRYQTFEPDPVNLINQIINQWRYNGQVIGREMGATFHQSEESSTLQIHLAVPTQDSLLPEYNSEMVMEAFEQAAEWGVELEAIELIGRDYNATETSPTAKPDFQILYTTHLEICSPLYDGECFQPIPLYHLQDAKDEKGYLGEQLIKWQEDWQACDQLQMNGSTLEQYALAQISAHDSELSLRGRTLAQAVEKATKIATYYYLYRLGKDEAIEHQRKCPNCGGEWKLTAPLHEIFHFQCQPCRLVSNLSWELL